MSERACIRGCTLRDVHYATCERSGPSYTGDNPCRGCAPRECRDGSLICDKCFGRMRGLLRDSRDILGRLNALADPSKAVALDQVRVAASTEPAGPVSADILDAIATVQQAVEWAYVDLSDHTNNLNTATYLSALLLNRHPDTDGVRHAWSVQDVVDRWGVERRSKDTFVYPDDDDEVNLGQIREWYDPLITVAQAAKRHKITQRAVRKWVDRGHLEMIARARGPRGSVMLFFRTSAVDAAAKIAEERRKRGESDEDVTASVPRSVVG